MLIASAPAADANHLIVGSPFGKGVVGRMDADESATFAHVFLECHFGFFPPRFAVVIAHDNFVVGEIGFETREIFAFWGRRNIDCK